MRAVQAALALAVCAGGALPMGSGSAASGGGGGGRALSSTKNQTVFEAPNPHDVQDVQHGWWTLYPEHYEAFAGAGAELHGVERLPQNQPFVAKAVTCAYGMSSMFENMEDLPLVEEIAKQVGERRGKDGVTAASLEDMRDLMLHLVTHYHKKYAELFPLGIVESSTRTLNWIVDMMKKGLQRQADKKKKAAPP
ncbi:Putative accessory gland protein [Gryllus bimaculatus]|nr:Putative accessory gland protein [Gryllus bimaculatus]